tara:strand:+ start:70 stop:240 length:171 start_codon:yes stop_codon:yes gene_type:complete
MSEENYTIPNEDAINILFLIFKQLWTNQKFKKFVEENYEIDFSEKGDQIHVSVKEK